MKELRRTNRFAVNRTVLYRSQGRSSLGTVVEVSLTGLRLRCTSSLEPGASATLVLLGRGSGEVREVQCRVHWQEVRENGEREAGLSFLSSLPELLDSWVGELLSEVEATGGSLFQRRESVRVPVRLPAQAGVETLTFAEIVEVSEGGAIVRTRRDWTQHQQIALRLSVLGRVVELQAVVRKVRRSLSPLAGFDYSLQFLSVGPREAELLQRLVRSTVRGLRAA